jgi:hypothetical protein
MSTPTCADNLSTTGDWVQQSLALPYAMTRGEKGSCQDVFASCVFLPCICLGCLLGMPCSCIGDFMGGKSSMPKINDRPRRQRMA